MQEEKIIYLVINNLQNIVTRIQITLLFTKGVQPCFKEFKI